MDFSKLSDFLAQNNEPAFRVKQIKKNYFSAKHASFATMTDLSLGLRTLLDANFSLSTVTLDKLLEDPFAKKARLTLADGSKIETVLMDYGDWLTACISSQVGCPLGCTFCATGKMGLKRNLTVDEIIDQVLFWKLHLESPLSKGETTHGSAARGIEKRGRLSRLVFMGMGEPFLNWDNLIAALKIINDKEGLYIGNRKISISTAGVAPRIIDFANLNTEINLAISLHSADQATREKMMPIARQYDLNQLRQSLDYYTKTTKRQVFFEYLLAQGVNDSPSHLKLLIDFIKANKLFYLNLIPLNPIKDGLIPSDKLTFFQKELAAANVNFSVRHSIGQSINSACGQLIIDK